ncbi:MAG: hypothetical protein LW636_06000 [Planctomycetaceae bacterium]|jgi:hypothetical protein|nr:hypothetical protein [Planctomycetaceae bacterium]
MTRRVAASRRRVVRDIVHRCGTAERLDAEWSIAKARRTGCRAQRHTCPTPRGVSAKPARGAPSVDPLGGEPAANLAQMEPP